LITGTLFRVPERRMSKACKPFVTATLRCKSGDLIEWWNGTAFSEPAHAELMRLKAGEAVAIQGTLKVSVFEKNGEHRARLDVAASHVTTLRQPRRERPKMTAVETGQSWKNRPPARSTANPEFDEFA
jgi:single-stranded DNA-binding protein